METVRRCRIESVSKGTRTSAESVHTILFVITLHIPDPPPVQNKTLPLKSPGWNTVVGKTGRGGGACFVLGFGMLDMIIFTLTAFPMVPSVSSGGGGRGEDSRDRIQVCTFKVLRCESSGTGCTGCRVPSSPLNYDYPLDPYCRKMEV
jgi:hypothetical protein